MACLIIARTPKLIEIGYYKNLEDLENMVDRMKMLAENPGSIDLRWQLVIDDDVLDKKIRQCEFSNWLNTLVLKNQ